MPFHGLNDFLDKLEEVQRVYMCTGLCIDLLFVCCILKHKNTNHKSPPSDSAVITREGGFKLGVKGI